MEIRAILQRPARCLLFIAVLALTSACVAQEPALEQCEDGVSGLSRLSDVAPPTC